MKTLRCCAYLLLLLLMPPVAAAQDGACIEVWSDWNDRVHWVDMDTGTVTSYDTIHTVGYHVTDPDGRYSAEFDPTGRRVPNNPLVLTDHMVGRSVTLAENAINPQWSPDGTWLA